MNTQFNQNSNAFANTFFTQTCIIDNNGRMQTISTFSFGRPNTNGSANNINQNDIFSQFFNGNQSANTTNPQANTSNTGSNRTGSTQNNNGSNQNGQNMFVNPFGFPFGFINMGNNQNRTNTSNNNQNLPPFGFMDPFMGMNGLNEESILNNLFILNQMRSQSANRPANKNKVDQLKTETLSEETCKSYTDCDCIVCQDSYKVKDVIIQMPCKHYYHKGCLLKWLETNNTCPTCRFKLE